jgi:biotin carboxylase
MLRALEECVVDGVESTIDFLQAILEEPLFVSGDISTRYLEEFEWDGETLTVGPSQATEASGGE